MRAERRKLGRPKGVRSNLEQDVELLREYDAAILQMDVKKRPSAPRLVAEHMKQTRPHEFPIDVASIEKRLRKRIKDREAWRTGAMTASKWLAAYSPFKEDLGPLARALAQVPLER
jgi:hypothetical protein